MRKPSTYDELSLYSPTRATDRSSSLESSQDPPRMTRPSQCLSTPADPSEGAAAVHSLCQPSSTHSETLPCMSCRPNRLGWKLPTGVVLCRLSSDGPVPSVLPSKLASAGEILSPKEKRVMVPARAAYSHSASESNR